MTKRIIAFGASNSKQSINKQLAEYTASQLIGTETTILDLNNFELPVYSVDLEKESGIPANAIRFSQFIKESDAIIISLAEYNGLHTSAFKNLWDWLSRIPMEKPMSFWDNKAMFLLSTSPSKMSNSNVIKISKELFPHFGANIIADFHLPSFGYFFKDGQIVEPKQKQLFDTEALKFQIHLNNI
ncbi:NADPH-dependent FMN reductase [Formosa sp. 3Alg 14/1]|uniref:NADPH-dependent FMN reductase n=1 Tax=unclassified Formosa TaxID=2644710 RepID=UPI0039BDF79B